MFYIKSSSKTAKINPINLGILVAIATKGKMILTFSKTSRQLLVMSCINNLMTTRYPLMLTSSWRFHIRHGCQGRGQFFLYGTFENLLKKQMIRVQLYFAKWVQLYFAKLVYTCRWLFTWIAHTMSVSIKAPGRQGFRLVFFYGLLVYWHIWKYFLKPVSLCQVSDSVP